MERNRRLNVLGCTYIERNRRSKKYVWLDIERKRRSNISCHCIVTTCYAEANDESVGPLDPGEPHLLPHGQLHLFQHQAVHVTDMKMSQMPICCLFEREKKSKTP